MPNDIVRMSYFSMIFWRNRLSFRKTAQNRIVAVAGALPGSARLIRSRSSRKIRTFRESAMDTQTVERKKTYCRVCMVHCGLVAEVVGEKIIKISGDRDHPITKGYTCTKGRATNQI